MESIPLSPCGNALELHCARVVEQEATEDTEVRHFDRLCSLSCLLFEINRREHSLRFKLSSALLIEYHGVRDSFTFGIRNVYRRCH